MSLIELLLASIMAYVAGVIGAGFFLTYIWVRDDEFNRYFAYFGIVLMAVLWPFSLYVAIETAVNRVSYLYE